MAYQLEFEKLVSYDLRKEGISVSVDLQFGNVRVPAEAKVDTGATTCVFGRAVAQGLGIELERGLARRFVTAAGSFIAYGHEVTLTVHGFSFDSLIFFSADEGVSRNVLGRIGWLNRLKIALIDYEGELYLSKYD